MSTYGIDGLKRLIALAAKLFYDGTHWKDMGWIGELQEGFALYGMVPQVLKDGKEDIAEALDLDPMEQQTLVLYAQSLLLPDGDKAKLNAKAVALVNWATVTMQTVGVVMA